MQPRSLCTQAVAVVGTPPEEAMRYDAGNGPDQCVFGELALLSEAYIERK